MPGLYDNGAGNVTVPAGSTSGLYQLSQDINVLQDSDYGNANVAAYLASGALTSNIITSGNVTANYFIGNGSLLTNINAANVVGGYGNANVVTLMANFGSNTVSTTGNITGGYILGNGSQLTGLPATYSNTNATSLMASFGSNTIVTTGNITGGYFIGDGSQLTNLPASSYGNANVAAFLPTYTGNLAGGNIAVTNNANIGGNLTVAGTIFGTFSGNITGNIVVPGANTQVLFNNDGNVGANPGLTFNKDSNALIALGNVRGSNVIAIANVVAAGVKTDNYYYANGTPISFAGTYGDSNVTTLLSSFGSNTISTTGNISAGNVNSALGVYAVTIEASGLVKGNGSALTSITGSAVTGTVANATYAISAGSATTATSALTAGTVTTAAQPNITSVGNLSSLTVTGDSLLQGNLQVNGNVTYIASNTVTINDKFINVANNAATSSAANGGGIGVGPVGAEYATWSFSDANTAWQSNIKIEAPAVTTTGNVTGSYIIGDGSQLTNLPVQPGTYSNANVTTLLSAFGSNSISTTGNVTAGYVAGNGSLLSNLTGANVTGTVALATSATTAGTVTTAAQPNITSVGTLSSLAVTGNISGGNVNSTFYGSGAGLSSLTGANVTGTVANATYATSAGSATTATTAGTVTTNAQPNITSVGTLSSLSVTGNIATGGILTNGYYYANGVPVTFGGGSTYGNANVSAYLASGTNTANIITTGNVTAGNVITSGASGNISGVDYIFANSVVANAVSSTGRIVSGAVTYANADGTAGQVLTTYGNGLTYFSTPAASYGNANVVTLLSAFGSNTLITTGNVSAGNLAVTGANAQLVMSGSTSNKINFGTTGFGPPTVGSYSNGAKVVLYDSISPTNAGYAIGIDSYTMWFNTDIPGSNFEYYVGNAKVATIEADGRITANAVTYTGTDGTAGQVLATYGNGVTYWTTGGGGTYGDSNVVTLMGAFGSNTISTTGNVTVGNLNMTGRVFDTSGVFQVNAAGNIILVPTGSTVIEGPTNITGGQLTTGAVTYANTDGTVGQVLTTYGNGVTYFSTVSGGSGSPGGANTQIQFNNAGAFAGNAAMTFNNTTGNVTLGNIVVALNQQLETVSAFSGNSSVRNPGQITVGDGYGGNITNTTYLSSSARGARLLSYDQYVKVDNGQRNAQIGALSYADLNTGNIGTANAATRIIGLSNEMYVINGNSVNSNPSSVRATQALLFTGTSANVGNANVSGCQVNYAFAQVNNGSRLGNVWMNVVDSTAAGGTTAPLDTFIGYGIRPGHTANATTGNVFGVYLPGTTATYGQSMGNVTRQASQYYFLRNDDDLAQNKLGSLRTFHEYRYDNSSSSGTLTVDKNNGQVQYISVTENITTVNFSNFVVSVSDGSTTDYQMDTVTLVFQQDATGRTITLPTPSTTYKYAGGTSTMGTTANAVQMISVSAVYNAGLAGTQYLITVSPEFA